MGDARSPATTAKPSRVGDCEPVHRSHPSGRIASGTHRFAMLLRARVHSGRLLSPPAFEPSSTPYGSDTLHLMDGPLGL